MVQRGQRFCFARRFLVVPYPADLSLSHCVHQRLTVDKLVDSLVRDLVDAFDTKDYTETAGGEAICFACNVLVNDLSLTTVEED